MGGIDQSRQLFWTFGPGTLLTLGTSTCGFHMAVLSNGPWYNHPIFLHRGIQATEALLG